MSPHGLEASRTYYELKEDDPELSGERTTLLLENLNSSQLRYAICDRQAGAIWHRHLFTSVEEAAAHCGDHMVIATVLWS